MDLVEFVRQRLDEDEAAAKACQSPSPWKAATHESDTWIVTDAAGEPLIYDEGTPSLEEAAHIARHDPARVLREVAAKRAIVARFGGTPPSNLGEQLQWAQEQQGLLFALEALAAVYSDHPDYDQAWRP